MQSTPELTWLAWMRVKASYQLTGLVGVGCFALLAAWTGLSQRKPNDRLLNIAVALGLLGITVGILGIIAEGSIAAPRVITPVIRSADATADDSDNLLNSKYVTKSTVTAPSFDKIDGKTVEINDEKYSVNDSNRVRTRYRPGQTAKVVITDYHTKKSVPKYIREMIHHEQSTDFLSMHQITTPEQDQAAYRTIMIDQPSK